MSEGEETLKNSVREDVLIGCRPRRTDLPLGGIVGIECSPDTDLVERLGVYGFGEYEGELGAYMARLDEAGISPRSGSCQDGVPGETTWQDVDENTFDRERETATTDYGWIVAGLPYMPGRIGCFHDENGNANLRVTCETGVYIGIVGKTSSIRDLYAWTYAGSAQAFAGEPGICLGASRVY